MLRKPEKNQYILIDKNWLTFDNFEQISINTYKMNYRLTGKALSTYIILFFSLGLVISVYSQDTIYIDPGRNFKDGGLGSKGRPFTSWQQVRFSDGHTYLQRRGTTDTVDHIFLGAGNIKLGCYGTGQKPIIFCKTEKKSNAIYCWKVSGIRIENLEIIAPGATSCIYFSHRNSNHVIDSCIVHESQWGIRITSGANQGHKILGTEVYNIDEDGIFIQDARMIEIASCYVHDVNRKWKPPSMDEKYAPGDGIQLSRCDNWHVHHNIIDRRSSGNKFCFISNNPEQTKGILEHNVFYCPLVDGSCVYFGDGDGMIVRYNNFIGNNKATALFHHASNLEVCYNIFTTFKTGIVSLNDSLCKVYNNTFYNIQYGIKGRKIESLNNIFDLKNKVQVPYYRVASLVESHNHFSLGNFGTNSTTGDPCLVDPENGNFSLKKESPCIDKGKVVNNKQGLKDHRAYNGTRPDIGAVEYDEHLK